MSSRSSLTTRASMTTRASGSRSFPWSSNQSASGRSTATAQMPRIRPSTNRSRRSATGTGAAKQIICAVTESRGPCVTVGLCFVNLTTGECVLCEVCDSQTYVRTVNQLLVIDPTEILLPSTAIFPVKTILTSIIEEHILGARITKIPRRYFNEQTGHEYVQKHAFKEDVEAIKVAISSKFYAMSAAAAALKYIELEYSTIFAVNALYIKYQAGEGSMLIDYSTVQNLELVQNIKNRQSLDSLFGLLNNTLTPMGGRLLRSNILQPLTDVATINARLDALEEFTQHEEMFYETRTALKPFLDVDRVLTALITIQVKTSLKLSEQAINNIIILKQVLGCVGPVFEALVGARSELLVAIKNLCNPERIAPVTEMIDAVINPDVTWAKSALDLRHQRCYAVKSGVNGLLDVARNQYKIATEETYVLIAALSEEHGLPLIPRFETGRGFYIRLPASALDERGLPAVFVNVVERKKMVEFTTLELIKRDAKISGLLAEVILMSDKTIQDLIEDIQKEASTLYKLAEGVAMLDMTVSFCHLSTIQDYVRPEFSETLAIKAGRHPLCEKIHSTQFVPNDIYASMESRFQIITGCNMSGKSTYIRSIALMTVIAQIGCFVPAQYASFPIILQLFARVSTDDTIEANASTFALEMRETAFILRNVRQHSMVIIDELGRGTGTRDGLAIALSVCEALVESKAFVWFATHFHEITSILADKLGVVNLHMQVEVNERHRFNMLYKVTDGPVKEHHYGLALAKLVGLPDAIVKRATLVSTAISSKAQQQKLVSSSHILSSRRKLVLALRETLTQARAGNMDEETLRSFLSQVQEEFVSRMYELNICATRVEDAAQTMEDSDERSSEGLDNTRPSTAVSATSSSTRTGDLMDIDEADEDRDEEDY